MSTDEKLLWMFEQVHGKFENKFSLKLVYNDEFEAVAVEVWKYGAMAWFSTKFDIMFDYLTKDL